MKTNNSAFFNRLFITILRIAIGWHLFYEGLSKILQGNWTSAGFLQNTSGFLSGFYHVLASSPVILKMTDLLNMYGLLLIGLALFVGVFCRLASLAGALLLTLYISRILRLAIYVGGHAGQLYMLTVYLLKQRPFYFFSFIMKKATASTN